MLVAPNQLAFAAHTAFDLGEAARERACRTLGAGKRLSGDMRTPTVHMVVFPSRTGLTTIPVTGIPPPNAA